MSEEETCGNCGHEGVCELAGASDSHCFFDESHWIPEGLVAEVKKLQMGASDLVAAVCHHQDKQREAELLIARWRRVAMKYLFRSPTALVSLNDIIASGKAILEEDLDAHEKALGITNAEKGKTP